MPVINYDNPQETEWMKTADRINGIPPHPSGEVGISNYYMAASGNQFEQRMRLVGIQIEIVSSVFIAYLFIRNFTMTLRTLLSRHRNLPLWCSFFSSLFGALMIIGLLLLPLTKVLNCRIGFWGLGFGMSVSMVCSSTILLHKAYLVLFKKKWIVYIGVLLIIPQAAYGILMVFYSHVMLIPGVGCASYYPSFMLWYWVAMNVPLNVLFSAIFCHATYKQYQLYGSDIWRRLTREGIQTMCLALVCNIICALLIIIKINGANMDLFYTIDWAVVTTILANHCCRDRSRSTVDRHIKTKYIQRLSQIDTVK